MNQGKLEVVKQEMARVNVDILGISELKCGSQPTRANTRQQPARAQTQQQPARVQTHQQPARAQTHVAASPLGSRMSGSR